MSKLLETIQELIGAGSFRISEHGYDELAADGLYIKELLKGLLWAQVVEEYPDYPKGPCVLVLVRSEDMSPVHMVLGIPKGKSGPAVLVTAYRPEQDLWDETFTRRLKP